MTNLERELAQVPLNFAEQMRLDYHLEKFTADASITLRQFIYRKIGLAFIPRAAQVDWLARTILQAFDDREKKKL